MGLLTPDFGLIFWMTVVFAILLFILWKFGFPVILKTIKDREQSIKTSLEAADKAKAEMKLLQANNEVLLKQAQDEKDTIIKEARAIKEKIIREAEAEAHNVKDRMIASARESINYEKLQAMTELKNQIANLAIEIAEDVLREELSNREKSNEIVAKRVKEITLS
ncbi:MAG: F0F1 ATP synthase subunit B [Bacteroidales bacterium]|jgi:F-type H+-transporting ATPase subunit b|nr:F0F1 ATP synthase subunit B [Bacteroidales bacterium]